MRALKKRGVDFAARRFQKGDEDVRYTPVTPTYEYPFPTDREFIQGGYPHETQSDDAYNAAYDEHEALLDAAALLSEPRDPLTAEDEDDMLRRENPSIGIEIDGKEIQVPANVSGLTPEERVTAHSELPPTLWPNTLRDKIDSAARDRLEMGVSPFTDDQELDRVQNQYHPERGYQSGTEDVEPSPTPDASSFFNRQALDTARQRGYNDDQIYERLSKVDQRFATAKANGFKLDDIADRLTKASPTPQPVATPQAGEVAPPIVSESVPERPSAVAVEAGEALPEQEELIQGAGEIAKGVGLGQRAVMNPLSFVSEAATPKSVEHFARTPLVSPETVERGLGRAADVVTYPAQTLSKLIFGQDLPEFPATRKFAAEQIAGQTTPENIAIIAGTEGVGALDRLAAKKVSRLTETIFPKEPNPLLEEINAGLDDTRFAPPETPQVPLVEPEPVVQTGAMGTSKGVTRNHVDSLLEKYQTPDDKSRLQFLSDKWDEPYMEQFKSNLNKSIAEVKEKMGDVPFSESDLQRRLLTSDALMEGKPEDIYPTPVYVGAEGDANTVGLLLKKDGKFEMFEGNDEATPQTLDLVDNLLGNAQKKVRVYTSQPAEVIQQIKAGNVPEGIFVSPNKSHAASYWGEGRDVTSFEIPLSQVAQHSEIDWQVRPPKTPSVSQGGEQLPQRPPTKESATEPIAETPQIPRELHNKPVKVKLRTETGEVAEVPMKAKEAEGIFTKEKSSYKALIDCLTR